MPQSALQADGLSVSFTPSSINTHLFLIFYTDCIPLLNKRIKNKIKQKVISPHMLKAHHAEGHKLSTALNANSHQTLPFDTALLQRGTLCMETPDIFLETI